SIKPTTPALTLPGTPMIEWNGSLRWIQTDASVEQVREAAAAAGGHATLFRCSGGNRSDNVFHPLSPALAALHRNLKQAFDPAGILNPGRLYRGM
ncbi:MAG TPA: FAD-linked oxidase C-terminal domain-containing protein, partial [Burkholderiales bacterium]|nr:FAD-linked oxidase C-terminal domain-containing protein [Burkholderiales bacterium]